MEEFSVHILGCGSANPTQRHRPASQVLSMRGKLFMVDCGEGTQTRMVQQGLAMKRLSHIFITHTHGDHCFGLPGLISTMGLLGRTSQLHIHAPQTLEPFLQQTLDTFCQGMDYKVILHCVDTTQHVLAYEDRSLEVWTLPLRHRIPCCGYLFREKQGARHIRREMIDCYEIPVSQINNIKAGADWQLPDGSIIPNTKLTTDPSPTRSWAYVSDTTYTPRLIPMLKGVNLLFHEATFGEDDELRARQTFHSTSIQAATIARKAHVGQLCIGHYSARIDDERKLLTEAKSIFENTILANEKLKIVII